MVERSTSGKPDVFSQRNDAMLLPKMLMTAGVTISLCGCAGSLHLAPRHSSSSYVIVYQPSHQADTGENFNEAEVSNAIAEGAIATASPSLSVHKVWSYNQTGLHHSRAGSNTKIEHTSALDSSGAISGYTYEIRESNRLAPDIFIAFHNNGATNQNACWGYVHEGDSLEPTNRRLAALLLEAVAEASGLKNAGVHGDSEPNRNDYRCSVTGKLSFYSLDENVNNAPVRVLLEIGDNALSRDILLDKQMQKKIGAAVQKALERVLF
jgi:hypothetical protein